MNLEHLYRLATLFDNKGKIGNVYTSFLVSTTYAQKPGGSKVREKVNVKLPRLETRALVRNTNVRKVCPYTSKVDGALEVPGVFLVCHGVLVLTDGDRVRKKFLTGRTPLVEKIAPRNHHFWRFSNSKSSLLKR